MPSVMIWEPEPPENRFGHAALHTDKYHISLWPYDPLNKFARQLDALTGVDGAIVFAHEIDADLEGNENGRRLPIELQLEDITDIAINESYEELLCHNDVDPSEVSLEKANAIINEWKGFSDAKRERLGDSYLTEQLSKKLKKTQYSYSGYIDCADFYNYPQSCTTICYHLIKRTTASDRHVPSPRGLAEELKTFKFAMTMLSPVMSRAMSPMSAILDPMVLDNVLFSKIEGSLGDRRAMLTVPAFQSFIDEYLTKKLKPEPEKKENENNCTCS